MDERTEDSAPERARGFFFDKGEGPQSPAEFVGMIAGFLFLTTLVTGTLMFVGTVIDQWNTLRRDTAEAASNCNSGFLADVHVVYADKGAHWSLNGTTLHCALDSEPKPTAEPFNCFSTTNNALNTLDVWTTK